MAKLLLILILSIIGCSFLTAAGLATVQPGKYKCTEPRQPFDPRRMCPMVVRQECIVYKDGTFHSYMGSSCQTCSDPKVDYTFDGFCSEEDEKETKERWEQRRRKEEKEQKERQERNKASEIKNKHEENVRKMKLEKERLEKIEADRKHEESVKRMKFDQKLKERLKNLGKPKAR